MGGNGRRAAWWWIDRWRKSTAYTDLTVEERGAYRELLDELWLRGGVIPKDERVLARIVGTQDEWDRVRAVVLARFKETPEGYRNETHDEVSAWPELQSQKGQKRAEGAARDGGRFTSRTPAGSPAEGPADTPASKPAGQPAKRPSTSRTPADPTSRTPASVSVSVSVPVTEQQTQPVNQRAREADGPKRSPFLPTAEARTDAEKECLRLVRAIAENPESPVQDGAEILAHHADYPGAKGSKVNPASMSDDRLLNTMRSLRSTLAGLERRTEPAEPIPEPKGSTAPIIADFEPMVEAKALLLWLRDQPKGKYLNPAHALRDWERVAFGAELSTNQHQQVIFELTAAAEELKSNPYESWQE